MKKWFLVVISTLIAITVLVCSFLVNDKSVPKITVNQNPVLACDMDMDDLLDYVSVSDDNLQKVFIEERDLLDILKKKKVTYVAIDEANNVTKTSVSISSDDEVNEFYIEEIEPLKIKANELFTPNKFYTTKNKCGWQAKDSYSINGVDFKTNGEYYATVKSKEYKCDDYDCICQIINDKAPTIHLSKNIVQIGTNITLSDYYFKEFIEAIDDDKSSDLIESVSINWQDIIEEDEYGDIKEGEYLITYSVIDEDGNKGNTFVKLEVNEDYNEYEPEIIEEEINEIEYIEESETGE